MPTGTYKRRSKAPKSGILLGQAVAGEDLWYLWLRNIGTDTTQGEPRRYLNAKLCSVYRVDTPCSYYLGYAIDMGRLVHGRYSSDLKEQRPGLAEWATELLADAWGSAVMELPALEWQAKSDASDGWFVAHEREGPAHIDALGRPLRRAPNHEYRPVATSTGSVEDLF